MKEKKTGEKQSHTFFCPSSILPGGGGAVGEKSVTMPRPCPNNITIFGKKYTLFKDFLRRIFRITPSSRTHIFEIPYSRKHIFEEPFSRTDHF